MWPRAVQAVGQMVEGELTAAVGSLTLAKRAVPAAELDALVGLVALQGGSEKQAVEQLSSAIRRGSTEPLVFYWAARAELQRGQLARALKRLQAALSIAPRQPAFHMAHAMVLSRLGRTVDGVASLAAAAREQPNLLDPSLYPSPVEGAVDLLDVILRGFPSRTQVLRTQGHLLWRAGRVTAACRRFRAVLDSRAGDADALQMAARCEVALGRTAEGLRLVQRALESAPGSAQALATRGEILLEQGKAKEAVKDLRKAADRLPTDGRLLARLAQACSDSEQPRCARRFFAFALRRQPRNGAAAFGLALHLQLDKDAEKAAEKAFRRAISLAPDNPRYRRAAASFAQRVGKKRLARRWLADARHLDRARARFEKVRARTLRTARLALRLSKMIRGRKGACDRSCRRALSQLPPIPRHFAEAHLILGKGRGSDKRLAPLLPRLRLGVLLLKDPAVYEQKARTRSGAPYVLRTMFPCVPAWRF
jgi:tetratricopeptide (TPR) repeat protein